MGNDLDTTNTGMESVALARAAGGGPARLIVLEGDEVGRRYAIEELLIIGRAADAGVRVSDPDVSRHHTQIRRGDGGECILEDLGSRNGTGLNGAPARSDVLTFGDRIQVGSRSVFLFTHVDPLEEQMLFKQKMEAIGHLGAGIAHDFNNLIGAVLSTIDYVERLPLDHTVGDPDVRECLTDARSACIRGAELIKRLLAFARRGRSRHELVDISELCTEVAQLGRRIFDQSIRIEVEIAPDLVVHGDRAQLHQLVMNLFINARDAMPRGGLLRFEASEAKPEDLEGIVVLEQGKYLLFKVEDTGVGMDAETQRRAFEPFFTTKAGGAGSGLGLATVSEVARWHGGHVQVTSEVGRGTRFRILLPSVDAPEESRPRRTTQRARRDATLEPHLRDFGSTPPTILVVDDEEIVRRSTGRLLQQAGYRVAYARDGREALEIFAVSKPPPDVVLLDLDMPELDGEATFERLQKMQPDVRVVFASGYWEKERERALTERGAVEFVPKPFDVTVLRASIRKALKLSVRPDPEAPEDSEG